MPSSDPIATLLETYHDLNPSVVEEFPHQNEEPSPLEFLRYVSRNRPCVFRGAARRWPAQQKWDARFLRDAMRGRKVRVAVTPAGYVSFVAVFLFERMLRWEMQECGCGGRAGEWRTSLHRTA